MSKSAVKLSIKKDLRFEYAHRLCDYDGKCANVHGHNQKLEVHFRRVNELIDSQGFVIDFGDVKKGIGNWIDENWDHGLILNSNDSALIQKMKEFGYKVFVMDTNPTAENMALYLLNIVGPSLYHNSGVEIFKVEVFENDFCSAIAELA